MIKITCIIFLDFLLILLIHIHDMYRTHPSPAKSDPSPILTFWAYKLKVLNNNDIHANGTASLRQWKKRRDWLRSHLARATSTQPLCGVCFSLFVERTNTRYSSVLFFTLTFTISLSKKSKNLYIYIVIIYFITK
jgi:hypothetical protein